MASAGKALTLRYEIGDLFDCPKTDSLAHCVSKDLRMGKGIAVTFKKRFGQVEDLKRQAKKVGEIAYLQEDGRYIYYLITKEKANDKPVYDDFKKSLQYLKKHCMFAKVTHLSMPRIGCGLDGLEWSKVEQILWDIFGDININITVYDLPPKQVDEEQEKKGHHSRDEKTNPKGDEKTSVRKDVKHFQKLGEHVPSKDHHSRNEKANPKGDEKTSVRKDEKHFQKLGEHVPSKGHHSRDEKANPKGDEKTSVRKDEKPILKLGEHVPSKGHHSRDEKASPKGDEKTSINNEKPFLKTGEHVASKDEKKLSSKKDAKVPFQGDEKAPSYSKEIIKPSPTKEVKKPKK